MVTVLDLALPYSRMDEAVERAWRPRRVEAMPRMLIQQPVCSVYTTSLLRTRRSSPCRYPRRRRDSRVYPNDQNVLTKPATMPKSVRYTDTAGPFCTAPQGDFN